MLQKISTELNHRKSFYFMLSLGLQFLLGLLLTLVYWSSQIPVFKKLVLVGLVIQFVSLSFWFFTMKDQKLEEAPVLGFSILNMLVFSVFLLPFSRGSQLFALLTLTNLMTAFILFKGRQQLINFGAMLFAVSTGSVVYGFTGFLHQPLETAFFQVSIITISSVFLSFMHFLRHELELQNNRLTSDRRNLQHKYIRLEKAFLLSRQKEDILTRDVKKKNIEIKNILTVSGQLGIRSDSRKALESILLTTIGQLGCSYMALLTKREKSQNYLGIYLEKGLRGYDPEKLRVYKDSKILQIIESTLEPLPVSLIPTDDLFDDEKRFLEQFRHDIIAPIFIKRNVVGLIIIGQKVSGAALSEEEFNLISIIANQAAFVLEQSQVINEFQDFYTKTMRAMIRALETKYVYARGHNVRTANYVSIMAQKMGVGAEEIRNFTYGALLHDIGKITVKDEFLLNAQPFTESTSMIKRKILEHTTEGEKILRAAGFHEVIVDMAHHHHEFFIGKGFPDGIGGIEIPLPTRLLAVCNAYDAMTSDRPHRQALTHDTARQYLSSAAGKQFDPEIVGLFLSELNANKQMLKYH
jgi:putative nucleotidyltransferase with HDIG domain